MAAPFTLTPQPIRVTSAVGLQPIYLAVDIGGFDQIDALLGLTNIVGISVSIELWTGMQLESDTGWVSVATFATLASSDSWDKKVITSGLLRYLRWRVATFSGTEATFTINCMGRSFESP